MNMSDHHRSLLRDHMRLLIVASSIAPRWGALQLLMFTVSESSLFLMLSGSIQTLQNLTLALTRFNALFDPYNLLLPSIPNSISRFYSLVTSLSSVLLLSSPSVFWQATSIRLVCYKQAVNNNMTDSEVEQDAPLNLTDRLTIYSRCF